MLKDVPQSYETLDYVSNGVKMQFKEDLGPLDPDSFEIFEGEPAYYVLKEVCTHLKLRKFLGP